MMCGNCLRCPLLEAMELICWTGNKDFVFTSNEARDETIREKLLDYINRYQPTGSRIIWGMNELLLREVAGLAMKKLNSKKAKKKKE